MSTPETRSYQDTKQAPCTIFQGPWKWQQGWAGAEPPHSVVCHIYGGPKMILVHGEPWSYGNRWNDPTLFEELAEMIRQAPEVRKERDELKARVAELEALLAEGVEAACVALKALEQ